MAKLNLASTATPPPDKNQEQRKAANDGALRLLQLESDVREASTLRELIHHFANETRAAMEFRQSFVMRKRRGRWRVEAISSVSTFERNAPLVRWMERVIAAEARQSGFDDVKIVSAGDPGGKGTSEVQAFSHLLWVPLKSRDGKVFAGLVAARETPWSDRLSVIAKRISGVYGHAWLALTRGKVGSRERPLPRIGLLLAAAGIAALFLIKAPITAIAPVEVVGRDTAVVAAPLDGVVADLVVASNQVVAAGDLLGTIEDTELRNAAEIAKRSVVVAAARYDNLTSGAFNNARARSEVAVAKVELALAEAERDLAIERLARVELRAPIGGVAILVDEEEWSGRPVAVGERILEIADPAIVEYRIELPVDDLIALKPDLPARIFLDSAPLDAHRAEITRSSYHATPQADGSLAYEVRAARVEDGEDAADVPAPRIGARGTAQILGEDASLAFILLRRPIAWVRQTFGL